MASLEILLDIGGPAFDEETRLALAAKRAGMRCVGVGASPELAGADIMIPGFENIYLNILKINSIG